MATTKAMEVAAIRKSGAANSVESRVACPVHDRIGRFLASHFQLMGVQFNDSAVFPDDDGSPGINGALNDTFSDFGESGVRHFDKGFA